MRGFKAGETSIIKQNEKFEVLYNSSGRSIDAGNGLVKPLTATNYDEFYMTAFYTYNDQAAPTKTYAAMWSTRYPIDAMMHKTNVGACGSDNYMWTHANQYDPATEIRGLYSSSFSGYAYPFMYIGVKDRDAQRTTLYHDGTAAIATDITLSDSIFNYDELILTFTTGAYQSNDYTTASAYPVSTIQIGKQLCGFNDVTGAYFAYEVTSATQLTRIHYQDYYLVDVQGIKNGSMKETVIFTNPSSSSVPNPVTLSQTYKNFDEICLVGHTADAQFEDMIVTQYYPVKALTREFDVPVNKRISLFLDAENCWLSIHGDTTLVPDTTSPAIILDKIIGIKKPSLVTAADYADITSLSVNTNGTYTAPSGKAYSPVSVDVSAPEYVDSNRGIVFYDNSGVSPVGFTKVDSITKSAFTLSTSEQATVECCCNISLAGTYGRIWQIGAYHSVGTTLAYNNSGAKPIFEIAISDTWDHNGTVDITDYLNTTITLSLVIKDATSELYLNGTKIEEYSIGKSTLVSDTGYLGFLHGQMSDRTTNGNLYALRVYHRALTAAEIQHNADVDAYYFGE